MSEVITSFLLLVGAGLLLLAALGVLTMPDLYTRMQPATKAATLGVSCVMLAAAVHFSETTITVRVGAIILFFLLTAPVAAHLIGRAAYFVGVPLWTGTLIDELRGRYDPGTHVLASHPVSPSEADSQDMREEGV